MTQPDYGIRTECIMVKTDVTFDSAGIPIAGHLYTQRTGSPGRARLSSSGTPAAA